MYKSIGYFFILFILFVSLKPIKTESVDLNNQSKLKQLWLERHHSTPTIIENNQSETSSSSFKFCIPFHTCHTELNHTILLILASICILTICCYYHCYEYCTIKQELDQGKFQQYHYIDNSVHNKAFSI